MKNLSTAIVASLFLFSPLAAATLDNHPNWKADKLPDLYYEVLAASAEKAREFQAPDGRFRSSLPSSAAEDEKTWSITDMQYIYVPALLYTDAHPANPRRGDEKTLEMALRAGDYLASCIDRDGKVVPRVNGKPVEALDEHRTLYCWTEALGLLREHLDKARLETWLEALRRAGEELVRDLEPRIDRPRYTSPFLGYSPNHFGLRATTIFRMGTVLDMPEWSKLTIGALRRFVLEMRPGGYWAEHDGPTMSYDYLNGSVASLYWQYTADLAAGKAMRANTDFHLYWCTPDGVDIHTVDQRNRNNFRVDASWGLFTFCHFPDGRRFARFKLLAALGESSDPLQALSLSALARIAQDAHYHLDGPEAPIPQESQTYRHSLDRPAVVKKEGPWVYSMSALVSPQRPLSQFYLDRIVPISLWHERSRQIIAGGNSKNQPELATFSVKRADGSVSYLPLDAFIAGSEASDTMCVAHEGYSLRLTIIPQDSLTAVISAQMEQTYNVPDSCFLNLPLRLHPGENLQTGAGKSFILGEREIRLSGNEAGLSLSHNAWRMSLPESARFLWPYYTYSPYGPVRVPKNIGAAMGVVSIPLTQNSEWVNVKFTIE
ncbi:MAG TPA: hypothetical protein VM123_14925 [archaeon]|nr:hypothetical protein [archaeon]